jgi:allantoinase
VSGGPITVVAGGTVVQGSATWKAHVVVQAGRVVAVTEDDAVLRTADEHVDARGLAVLPGAVDLHTHFEDVQWTEREDYGSGTRAAAAGGFTTIFEHPLTDPLVTTAEIFAAKLDRVRRLAILDFGLWGALTAPSLDEMEAQWRLGASGFKAFMASSEPNYPRVTDDEMRTGMTTAARLDALVLVHAESEELLQAHTRRVLADGRRDMAGHHDSRPPEVELAAVSQAIELARETGARLQVVHVSTPGAAALIRDARAAGTAVTMEVCGHHLLLDRRDAERLGPFGRCAPPLRERELVEALWGPVLDGTADALVTDHCGYTVEEKEAGRDDVFVAPNGLQVIQETIALTMDEALHRRGMSLPSFARLSATRPAEIARLAPIKGAIVPGADADLTLWDLDAPWTVRAGRQQHSKNPWSPWEGRRCRVRLRRTILRGRTIHLDGEVLAEPGTGRFLPGQGASGEGDGASGSRRGGS